MHRVLGGGRYLSEAMAEQIAAETALPVPEDRLSNREYEVLRGIANAMEGVILNRLLLDEAVANAQWAWMFECAVGNKLPCTRYPGYCSERALSDSYAISWGRWRAAEEGDSPQPSSMRSP